MANSSNSGAELGVRAELQQDDRRWTTRTATSAEARADSSLACLHCKKRHARRCIQASTQSTPTDTDVNDGRSDRRAKRTANPGFRIDSPGSGDSRIQPRTTQSRKTPIRRCACDRECLTFMDPNSLARNSGCCGPGAIIDMTTRSHAARPAHAGLEVDSVSTVPSVAVI